MTKRETADPSPPDARPRGKSHDRIRAIAPTLVAAVIAGTEPPYPPKPAPDRATMTKAQRKAFDRRKRKEEAAALAEQQRKDAAEHQERQDEKMVPAVQRKPILAADGSVLYHPRLERDGLTFIRSNPVRRLAAVGRRRTKVGMAPTIEPAHERASDRLLATWNIAGETVTAGTANYGERASGTPTSGYISEALLGAIATQRRAMVEIDAAKTWLGPLWPIIYDVVIRGMDVTAWAEAHRKREEAMTGYLAAALDKLVQFYTSADRPAKMRSAAVVHPVLDSEPVS